MTRRRWIADEVWDDRAALTGAHAEHLSRVLRAKVGQEFDIAIGSLVRRGRIISLTRDRVDFELSQELLGDSSAGPQVSLALSVFKFDRMEWAIEKCAELGAARIIPLLAQRSEKHLAIAAVKRAERWRRIACEAAEQSRRLSPPEISDPVKVKELIQLPARLRIVMSETEKDLKLSELLRSRHPVREMLIAIGPEGGWTEAELTQFSEAGWVSASLGKTILRAETAAIAATALAMAELVE